MTGRKASSSLLVLQISSLLFLFFQFIQFTVRECCMFCSQKSMPHACSCKWMCVYPHNFKGCLLQNVRHLTYSVLFGINNTNLFQFSLTKDLLIICSHVYKFVQVCLVPAQIVSPVLQKLKEWKGSGHHHPVKCYGF